MAEFLTTFGTSSRIEEIMINAKKEIYLVSPFLQISKTFYERLKDASDNGIDIKIIYGKDELKPNERKTLTEIQNLELFYFKTLHAKCYFNESKMVITSMNMYEFSEKNNREMGVLVDIKNDLELFESAKRETLAILKLSEKIILNKPVEYSAPVKTYNNSNNPIIAKKETLKKRSFGKFPLSLLENYLSDEFRDSKINAARDYLFSENLVPVFHVFVQSTGIKLKLPLGNPSKEEVNNISSKLMRMSNYDITFNAPNGGYSYYTWDIEYFLSLKDYSNVIKNLRELFSNR